MRKLDEEEYNVLKAYIFEQLENGVLLNRIEKQLINEGVQKNTLDTLILEIKEERNEILKQSKIHAFWGVIFIAASIILIVFNMHTFNFGLKIMLFIIGMIFLNKSIFEMTTFKKRRD